jgi:GntR family transcriptional regulator, transcriptional repressor for pyruvate dehydrogenase complex
MNQNDLFQSLNLKRQNLHERIAQAIQDMIAEDKLPRGSQLPPEREFAKLLGVNRTTLREAIHLLEQRGLVEMKAGSGTYVTDTISGSILADSIERQFVFGNCTHEDLVTLREIVEPGVAALAAARAEPEDLARLKDLAEQIEEAFVRGDSKANTEADVAFHDALAIATHNGAIIAISAGLHKAMLTSMLAQATIHIEEGARSHRSVYEAIVARDPARAREAMEFHMTTTRRSQLSLTKGRVLDDMNRPGDVSG